MVNCTAFQSVIWLAGGDNVAEGPEGKTAEMSDPFLHDTGKLSACMACMFANHTFISARSCQNLYKTCL